jgi:hypothetical protein
MQTSIEGSSERRKSATPRIPVDLLVELCAAEEPKHEARRGDRKLDSWSDVSDAFGESYDADGLDLSATGLRLRSSVLPDVGQRLRCRFDLPDTDAKCEAEGRVVWSNDSGRHGEFGLRFDALAPAVESALARWAMDRGPTTLPGTEPAPGEAAPSEAAPKELVSESAPRDKRDARRIEAEARIAEARLSEARATEARATEARATEAKTRQPFGIARVRFDGVSSAIEAEISVRDELRLDVAQALPFFELGRLASVEADGSTERRRLEHVSLRIENGVPKLILGLVAEISSSAGTVAAPSMEAESTIQDESLDELLAKGSTAQKTAAEPASDAMERSEERIVEARSSMAPSSSGGAWVTGDEDEADAAASDEESLSEGDESLEARASKAHRSGADESQRGDKDKAKARKRPLFDAKEDSLDDADPRVQADRKKKLDEVRRVLLDGEELPEAPTSSAGAEPAATGVALDRVKSKARAVGAAIQPTLSRLTTALRTGWAAFVAGVGPRSKAAYAAVAGWIARVASLVSERVRDRMPRLAAMLTRSPAKEKRRTTAAPPASAQAAASPRRQRQSQTGAQPVQAAEVVAARPRVPLRWVLLGVVALGAVGSLAYAFGGGSAEPAPIVVPAGQEPATDEATEQSTSTSEATQAAPSGVESAALLAPATPASTTSTVGSTATTSAAALVAAPQGEPSALAAPSTDEGRLPMPGYPSIGRASDTSAASSSSATSLTAPTTASSTPAAPSAGPVTTGRSFGSDRVDGGQTVSLRMSLAPTTLEGQADPHGFTVTIRGALSLGRAATIARSNPAVDRASVLNRGDHAVLDVRFVEGRSPAYRVEIRGETVDITIGR